MVASIPISTSELCNYGCYQVATWQFANGKICCSQHYNSCPKKRSNFSESQDHKSNAQKSLAARVSSGVIVTCQIKGTATRKQNGTYERAAAGCRKRWMENPYTNNKSSPIARYEIGDIPYQGSYELAFLNRLLSKHGANWLERNVKRGPGIWYNKPGKTEKSLYLPDYIIGDTIYEIKSSYTWNKLNKDKELESVNNSKLISALDQGYNVILVLDHKEINYGSARSMG